MFTSRTKPVLPAYLAMLLAAAVMPGTALAQESPQNQHFVLVATDTSGMGRLVATGPIRGVGTDTTFEHTAKPDGTFTDSDRFERGRLLRRVECWPELERPFAEDCAARVQDLAASELCRAGLADLAGTAAAASTTAELAAVAERASSEAPPLAAP